MTDEEKACSYETLAHIHKVQHFLRIIVALLLKRGDEHDASKLSDVELEAFTKFTPMLANLTYGSPEYEEVKQQMGPALEHHYAVNAHHPEHHKKGLADMTLIDLIEMLADWIASSKRQTNGNIAKTLEVAAKKYNMSPLLIKIMENTVSLLEEMGE